MTQSDFNEFETNNEKYHFVTMTNYDSSYKGINVVFQNKDLRNTLGEVLEKNNKTQLRIAETEKYPHVTFFFSGGREKPFSFEKRILKEGNVVLRKLLTNMDNDNFRCDEKYTFNCYSCCKRDEFACCSSVRLLMGAPPPVQK